MKIIAPGVLVVDQVRHSPREGTRGVGMECKQQGDHVRDCFFELHGGISEIRLRIQSAGTYAGDFVVLSAQEQGHIIYRIGLCG